MAKSEIIIGYGETQETSPGVWRNVVTERKYFADVTTNSMQQLEGDKVNNDLSIGNSLSVIADAYANGHFFAIKYVKWAGTNWMVSNVTVDRPRLILRMGGVYNGPTDPTPESVREHSGN